MDALLARIQSQALNCAIRYGVVLTSDFAIQQYRRLLVTVDDKPLYRELKALQKLLDNKIKIISPALDLIEFKSGRGNVILGHAASLAKSLHRDIVALGSRLEKAAAVEEVARLTGTHGTTNAELRVIITEIKALLDTIDGNTPLIQLAISASGESLSTHMPQSISPSRFLQASAFLTFGDTQYAQDPRRPVQIGPSFSLSLYMLFLAHTPNSTQQTKHNGSVPTTPSRSTSHEEKAVDQEPYGIGEGERKPIWQEVLHKARVRICRIPENWEFDREHGYRPRDTGGPLNSAKFSHGRPDQFGYYMEIVEDLDDGRVHDEEVASFDDVVHAGIRESIPIHQISKIFYTDTGRILNIGSTKEFENSPVLLLKRDFSAPQRTMEQLLPREDEGELADIDAGTSISSDDQAAIDRQLREESVTDLAAVGNHVNTKGQPRRWHLPPHLDPEWVALEVFVEDEEGSDSEAEDDGDEVEDNNNEDNQLRPAKARSTARSSLDSKLINQIRNLSIRSPPGAVTSNGSRSSLNDHQGGLDGSSESFVARSPFGNITSSLSLMEMLIRLTSLQEVQQTSHLAIPDHILNFFLEEASTTGVRGEERWKVRNEAKRRVGFDPYTDTPTK